MLGALGPKGESICFVFAAAFPLPNNNKGGGGALQESHRDKKSNGSKGSVNWVQVQVQGNGAGPAYQHSGGGAASKCSARQATLVLGIKKLPRAVGNVGERRAAFDAAA